jgi:hypothetical protein
MIVELSSEVLADAGAYRHLTAIFWMTVDGRHRWHVEEQATILQSPWFRSEGALVQRRIREQLGHTERHVRARRIVVAPERRLSPSSWALPPAQAERFLQQPVHVFVENADSDGTFLRAVVLRCGERSLQRHMGHDAWSALKSSWTTPA